MKISKKMRKRLLYPLGDLLLPFLAELSAKLPRGVGHALFTFVAKVALIALPKEVQRARQNISMIYPDLNEREVDRLTKDVFIETAISFFDSIYVPNLPKEKFDSIVKFDSTLFMETFKKGKGLIAFTGHLSCFELLTHITRRLDIPVLTIGTELHSEKINNLIYKLRTRNGIKYTTRNRSLPVIIKHLKSGGAFGALIDQDTTDDGIFLPFLGKPAFTPATTARLSAKYDIPVIFMEICRDKKGVYHLTSSLPSDMSSLSQEEKIEKLLSEFNEHFGKKIKETPSQWMWMHRRWRRQPQPEDQER